LLSSSGRARDAEAIGGPDPVVFDARSAITDQRDAEAPFLRGKQILGLFCRRPGAQIENCPLSSTGALACSRCNSIACDPDFGGFEGVAQQIANASVMHSFKSAATIV
jgi:hypothetical protein